MSIGKGWPNGPVDNARILALPGPILMLSSEHWHVQEAQQRHQVLYRIVPPLAQRPAVLSWNPNAYVKMIVEQVHGLQLTDLVWANELDLNYERGDEENDFLDLEERYTKIAIFGSQVLDLLKLVFPNTKIHWPAFTPNKDHNAIDYAYSWGIVADRHDVVDFHAYDSLDNIQHEHSLYRKEFAGKELALTEWHCKGNLVEEQRVIQYLMAQRLQSYFFIYEWFNYPDWWSTEYDIANNPPRYDMFMNAVDNGGTMVECPTSEDMQEYAKTISEREGIPWEYTFKQFQQESRWRNCRSDGTILTSSSNAKGVAQIKQASHPNVNVENPWDSLDYAIGWISDMKVEFGEWKKAYAGYHDGPYFVRGYTDAHGNIHEPWNGKRDTISPAGAHYLDVILGSDWDKETSMPSHAFQLGFKALANELGADVVGTPLTDEIYFTPDVSMQYTTTGKMEYSKAANKSYFFLAAQK